MTSDSDKYWKKAAGKLRRAKGLCPMTPEEAEAAFDAAPHIPIPPEDIQSIVQSVTSGEFASWEPTGVREWSEDGDLQGVNEDVMQLFRNEGEPEESASAQESDLEEELLSDDESEENNGLAGDSGDPRRRR